MTASLVQRFGDGAMLEGLSPAGVHRAASGARVSLATGESGGRRVLLAETDTSDLASVAAAAVLAESLDMLSLTVMSATLTEATHPPKLSGTHVLVGPPPSPAVAATLERAGFLLVAESTGRGDLRMLDAADTATGVDVAALLLSYLPSPSGVSPVYAPLDRDDIDGLGSASARNTVATVFGIADDALRVLPTDSDELVLALARVFGASVAVIAPQRLAGTELGAPALVRVGMLLRLAGRANLPVVVLGGLPEPVGDPDLLVLARHVIAAAIADLRRPLLLVPDDAGDSSLDALFASGALSVTVAPGRGVRAGIAPWLPLDPA